MPQLSVIVTSYNIQDYLGACLDSILNQSLRDIEIIVVDDGSSDSSPDLILEYAARDDRIVPIIRGERSPGGVATAANAGLDLATAPYVGFADGDDLYEPEMFERLLTAALEHDSDLVMCNYRLFSDDSPDREAPADERRWLELMRDHYELDDDLRHTFLRFVAVPWRKLYRRELLEANAIRFPVGDYFFEDNPFHWFSLIHASSIALVPEVLCYHRVARAGQTMATADERVLRIFQHHATIYSFLEAQGKRDEFATTLLAWAMSQMEWISRKVPQNLYRKLYEALVVIFDEYTEEDVERALVDAKKGRQTRNLSIALSRHNYARFVEVLKNKDDRRYSLPVRLINHLRYSGIKQTAQMSVRFANQRLRRGPSLPNALASFAPRREKVTHENLMFALAALENRLDRIELQLHRHEDGPEASDS
ncbi:glycosyltransferase family 2 protein [Tessaracoccus sp. Y1736]